MSAYRFHPLASHPNCGVMVTPDGPRAAEFLTPEQAREIARAAKKQKAHK